MVSPQPSVAGASGSTWDGDAMTQDQMMERDTVLALDYEDKIIGSASKRDSHEFSSGQPRGVLHRAFSVFLFDQGTGELLLQQRAKDKITFPNVWTNTCCSHPLNGMDPSEVDTPDDVKFGTVLGAKRAAIRKLRHELGIPPHQVPVEKFKFLTRLHYWAADTVTHGKKSPWGEHEIDYVLFIILPDAKNALTIEPHPEEVGGIRWISKSDLADALDEANAASDAELWSPWFRLIAKKWLLPHNGWWEDLNETVFTDKHCDYESIHRFDPPREHMGGGGDAGPWLGDLSTNGATTLISTVTNGHTEKQRIGPQATSFTMPLVISLLIAICAVYSVAVVLYLMMKEQDASMDNSLRFLWIPSYNQAICLCFVSISISILFVATAQAKLKQVEMGMPHVPSGVPFLGCVKDFLAASPWDKMTGWHKQYGPVYSFNLLGRNCVSIADPTYLRVVLQSKIKYVKKDVKFAMKPFLPILGTGIVTSEGKSWMRQRLSVSSVLRINVLDKIPDITLRAVQRLYCNLDAAAENGEYVDLGEELRHLTLQVISETFFSLSAEESNKTFAKMYLPIVEEGNVRVWHPERGFAFFLPFFWRHKRNCSRLDTYVSNLIRDRWNLRETENMERNGQDDHKVETKKRQQDILDHIMSTFESKEAWKGEESIRQLRDEMKTFMLAGHETSAAMMTWALFELLQDEELLNKATMESFSVFGDKLNWASDGEGNELPTRETLDRLEFCEGCLKESLRKYSVVPTVSRRAVAPIQIGPYVIPKGTTIFVGIQGVHHNEKLWPEPMKFDPCRFCDSSSPPVPYTFIPFIEGPRNCLGQYLALLESKMVLALLLQRYRFKFQNSITGEARHRYMVPVIPREGIKVLVTKRG